MDHIDRDGFRENVGIILMHDDGRVFLGRRTGGRGWQCPQGGVQRGEIAEQAMYRELEEEIGLPAAEVEILAETRGWLRYRLPSRYIRRDSLPLCIGQKQRWYLLRSRRDEPPVRFDCSPQPEFDGWRWAAFWEPVREVIHFKRAVYQRALHELGGSAFPTGLPPYPAWWTGLVAGSPKGAGAQSGTRRCPPRPDGP
jgi:putative (di)nucleoside polyphosphate hydrolase